MAKVIIRAPDGKERTVERGGFRLSPGWKVVGIVRSDNGPQLGVHTPDKIDRLAHHFGMDVADFVERAARALGIPPCLECQMRGMILRRADELGWWKTVVLLSRTFLGKLPDEDDAGALKEFRDGD